MLLDHIPCLFFSWGSQSSAQATSSGGEGPTNALSPKTQACECEATGDNAKGDGEVAFIDLFQGTTREPRAQSIRTKLGSRSDRSAAVERVFGVKSEFQWNQMAHTAFRQMSAAKWLSSDRTARHAVDGEFQ
jgi:hypothetical protein